MHPVHPDRVTTIRTGQHRQGCTVYWMSRDQRADDNWALLYAQQQALKHQECLVVVFCLADKFLGASSRMYDFMLNGLAEVEKDLRQRDIPFFLLKGDPGEVLPDFIRHIRAGLLISDFDPLRIKRNWQQEVSLHIEIPFHEVDAHNIVPCRIVSNKQEYGAYTLRPKIHRRLMEYFEPFPELIRHPYGSDKIFEAVRWDTLPEWLRVRQKPAPITWLRPGGLQGKNCLEYFIQNKLNTYESARNDPNRDGQSNLSPYLHFGQLSAQRVAIEVESSQAEPRSRAAFMEELIVRRELSDNYCFHNKSYDSLEKVPVWVAETLNNHRSDPRPVLYSEEEFESAGTHDRLWNAAQQELIQQGKMHGYMRMYWAKKILEWTPSPEAAFQIAVHLNDTYSLDGRDPNGYAGIAWSIAGIHDRPWFDRPIFGKVRYMNANGAKKKFDVEAYIRKWLTEDRARRC